MLIDENLAELTENTVRREERVYIFSP